MDELDKIFRQSIEQDRSFPVAEKGWTALERELEQSSDRSGSAVRWRHLLLLLCLSLLVGGQKMEVEWRMGHQAPSKQEVGKFIEVAATEDHVEERPEAAGTTSLKSNAHSPAAAALEKQTPEEAVLPQMASAGKEKPIGNPEEQMQSDPSAGLHRPVEHKQITRTTVLSSPPLEDSGSITEKETTPTLKLEEHHTVAALENLKKDRRALSVIPSRVRRVSVAQIGENLSLQTYSSGTVGLYISPPNAPAAFENQNEPANWQLGLSYGGWFGNRTNVLPYFTTEPGGNLPGQIYLFPSGDTMQIFHAGSVTDKKWFLSAKKIQFDLHHTTDFGLGLRLGLLYTYNQSDDSRRTHLIPDQPGLFYYVYKGRQSTWTWELGLNYTLNRHKRLQPYVELSGFALVSQRRTYTSTAFFPEQNYEFLENRYKSVSTRLFYGYYAGLGVQWLLTDHLSVGPKIIFARQPGPPIMTMGGSLEARYRW